MSAGKACCPSCKNDAKVTDRGRRGGSGQSVDVWHCSQHGEFTTPAR